MTEHSHQIEQARSAHLQRRYNEERRFKLYGQIAIGIAVSFLAILLISIAFRASSAFSRHMIVLDLDPATLSSQEDVTATELNLAVHAELLKLFPELADSRVPRRDLFSVTPRLAVLPVLSRFKRSHMSAPVRVRLALSDELDLYLKGPIKAHDSVRIGEAGRLAQLADGSYRLTDAGMDNFLAFEDSLSEPTQPDTDILISLDRALFELTDTSGAALFLTHLAGPLPDLGEQQAIPVSAIMLGSTSANRPLNNRQIALAMLLRDAGKVERRFNASLFSNADSTYPELAGAAAAIVGSLFTMFITALFAIPIGIFAAIYLEEFAPQSRLTQIIEININNLAAVPSIIFGLLGATVFLNTLGLPRSVPLVGGLVLGLLVLPTIIIASRAALRAVPPSMRDAALGLGASKSQAVFHHVLPLAAPGILTGAIIAMARALGETAPLLLIGMVAFVSDVPTSPNDEATVLPVLIYKWFSGSERAWEPMTAAIIIILLTILVAMNLLAVLLRRRFERRW
jgi:phosphate transport system permease protein